MERGKFIVLEGQGLTGKTEQVPLLAERLRASGREVVETQEPGRIPENIHIWQEIEQKRSTGQYTPDEMTELFFRTMRITKDVINKPALDSGKWLVGSRYVASTYMYQGLEGGSDPQLILDLQEEHIGEYRPDLYVLLDVTPEEILARMRKSEESKNRLLHSFNEKDKEKLQRRRDFFLSIAQLSQLGNWEVVDGNQSIDDVSIDIWESVTKRFGSILNKIP